MQSEEFKEICFEHQMMEDYFLEGILADEEEKECLPDHESPNIFNSLEKKVTPRGKGRPKGEKNCKNTEKKGKDNLAQ